MEQRLKRTLLLAERRGIFQRPQLSYVQNQAAAFLVLEEERENGRKITQEIKEAVLASGLVPPHKVFPDFFIAPEGEEEPITDETGAAVEDENAGLDLSGVKWVSPTQGEDYDLLASALADLDKGGISVSGDLGEDVGGDWV